VNHPGHFTRSMLLCLFCLIAAGLLWGPGGAPKTVNELVAASQHIVVGTVVQGTVSGTAVALSIQIERVLKGSLAPEAVVAATGTISEPWQTRAIARHRGIFFLADAGTGPMRLVPIESGYLLDERQMFMHLPDSSTPAAASGAGSDPKERVWLEILGEIEAAPPNEPGGLSELIWEYHASPTPGLRSVFRRWLASGSPELAAIGAQVLLAEGDATALSRIAADPALRSTAVKAHAFDGLKFYFKNSNPAAVKALGRLASDNSNGMELRIAAASGLARVHTRQALPFLALLLDSPDPTLRTLAVGGLSMFANNVPTGSHEPAAGEWPWRTDDTIAHSAMDGGNVAFWKSWWGTNQTALMQ
jgi:hypothetical protein